MTVDTGLARPPELDIDPFTEANLIDPTAVQTAIRETAPVVWLSRYNLYAVGRHDLVQRALSDYACFTSTGGIGMSDIRKPGAWRTPSPIAEIDPPGHADVRRALQKVLSPVVIRQWREDFTREAEARADAIMGSGTIEAVSELVEPFILKVFPDALGVG
ncbi:MAG: cytochrome P450, partial [Pseudomonadota bacterium]|nr:cytochrome P450 [Pseudomonadota bacterium]